MPKNEDTDTEGEEEEEGSVYAIENEIFFYTDVSVPSIQKLHMTTMKTYKKYRNHKNSKIVIHLMSEGGNVFAGFAAFDFLKDIAQKIELHIVVEGFCASAASLILFASDHRFIRSSGMVLLHDIRSWFGGKYQ